MSGDVTQQALERQTWMPDRPAAENGVMIAGQRYYDVEFTGGNISGVTLSDVIINGVPTSRPERIIEDAGNVTVLSDDYIITLKKTVPEPTTILLPLSPTPSRTIIVKDGLGNAQANSITLDGNGNNIDASPTFVMGTDWEAVEIVWNGTEWNLIASYGIGGGGGGGSGTVTSVSVVTANGFSGSVSNATTTPAITINASGLDASKIANGSVSNAEFQYLDGVTSSIQTQIDGKQAAGNYITALTGDVVASGPGSASATLATVNSDVGSFTNANITVDAKGRITAASNGSGGGSSAFNDITSGTNTTAAMVVGSGATLSATGTGTISATSAPLSGISGLGAGVATFLATPSSANLAAAVTGETGTGALVFATSPTLTTPNLGTPSAVTLTNATGLPLSTGVTGDLALSNLSPATNASTLLGRRSGSSGDWEEITLGTNLSMSGTTLNASGGSGGGDVSGPSSSTDNAIARFDSTTGKIIQNSGATIDDSGNLTANNFTGSSSGTNTGDQTSVTGNAGTVTVVDAAADTTTWVMLATTQTGNMSPATDAGITYNANTNALSATTFTGALSGNATTATTLQTARTIGGVSFNGSANIVPQTIQSVAETSDTTCYPLFISASGSQSLQPLNNSGFIYNASANTLTATGFVGALTGNASTATSLQNGRTIAITGDLSYTSPSFDGSGNVTAAGTLATVNSNVGTFTNATITVNGKGLITAASNGSAAGDVTAASNIADNVIVRGDGGAKGVQGTGITIADTTDAMSGVGTITPKANNTQQLGSTSNQWADLFLGDGAVINWDNGDITITETSSTLAFSGANSYAFDADITGTFYETLWVPAAAMRPSATGGCQPLTLTATGANQPDLSYLAFDPSTDEFAQFNVTMPSRWVDISSLSVIFYWSHPATTVNYTVVWGVQAVAVSNDDPIGTAFGTAGTTTDAGGTTNDLYISSSTSVTPAGSISTSDNVIFRVYRDADNGSDNLAVDAYLLGVKIRYQTSRLSDNA